jgi:hypothetical protein
MPHTSFDPFPDFDVGYRRKARQPLYPGDPGGGPHTELEEPAIVSMVELANSVPDGCFVEVGVFCGGSAFHLYQIAKRDNRALHLFDTFSGMPFMHEGDAFPEGHFNPGGVDKVKQYVPTAIYHVGIFPDTLPADLDNIAFCHVDCDQYQSVKDCITYLWPKMVTGGIMLFDDTLMIPAASKALFGAFTADRIQFTPANRNYLIK